MDATAWTIVGIIVTLVTFVIVYWKTAGARGEREKQAHKEIVAVLVRLLVDSQDNLDLRVVDSLIRSKAREYDINLSTVDEIPRIVEDLVARFSGSEFITPAVRHDLIERTLPLQEEFGSKKPSIEEATTENQEFNRFARTRRYIISATVAALMAGIVTVTLAGVVVPPEVEPNIGYAFIAAIALLAAVMTYIVEYRQLKSKQAESGLHIGKVMEEVVYNMLRKGIPKANIERHVRIRKDHRYFELDFVIRTEGEVIAIEVKTGPIKREAIETMANAMRELESKRGIIVTSATAENEIREIANRNRILLVDSVTSEERLRHGLRDAKLVV